MNGSDRYHKGDEPLERYNHCKSEGYSHPIEFKIPNTNGDDGDPIIVIQITGENYRYYDRNETTSITWNYHIKDDPDAIPYRFTFKGGIEGNACAGLRLAEHLLSRFFYKTCEPTMNSKDIP